MAFIEDIFLGGRCGFDFRSIYIIKLWFNIVNQGNFVLKLKIGENISQ